jgi:1,4-dihydroxy-2-naphthoate polyprenyltransferase
MMKNNPWIEAARLRTLPLSVSGIIVGSIYALSQSLINWKILILGILTTIGLQILSNFANDYGDGVKGTDNQDRVGPVRAIQSGAISPKAMKKAIVATAVITFFFAIGLIYVAFSDQYFWYSIAFLVLGILAVFAAITYTVGENAYGYKGLGDIFVFVFFGWVSTLGIYFLYAKQLDYLLFFPASALGLLSAGVLNINNMRDSESDAKSNKITLAVKMGKQGAKMYHAFLIFGALVSLLFFAILSDYKWYQYLFVLIFVPIFKHLKVVYNNKRAFLLDGELKKLALGTFVLSVLVSISFIL